MHSHKGVYGKTAFKLLKGVGLEIGALHQPFDLEATVIYLDRFSKRELHDLYKDDHNINVKDIQSVHLVAESDYYSFIDEAAFDFVVSSHVLEHVCNPGRVIEEWLRIVKNNTGIVYFVVPDKRFCFDRMREVTTVEHLMQDYYSNIKKVEYEHYKDFILNVDEPGAVKSTSAEYIRKSFDNQVSIHVHTFTDGSMSLFLDELQQVVPMKIIHYNAQGLHIHVALKNVVQK
jgi:SAM-dependent methyltransferase